MSAGTVYPLRVLSQDELFSAAFAVIRHAPRAVLGLPFLAGILNFAAAILLLALFPSQSFLRLFTDPAAFDDNELAWAAVSDGGLLLLLTLSGFIGNMIMALSLGLLAIPTLRAAYGLPTTLKQTVTMRAKQLGWLALHLIVLTVLMGVIATGTIIVAALIAGLTFFIGLVVILPGLYLLLCWLTAGLMYGPLVTVVERRNAFSAIGRSFSLNRGQWWRNIGVVALFYLVTMVAMLVASVPAGLVTGFGGEIAWDSSQEDSTLLALLVLGFSQLYDSLLSALLTALAGTLIGVMYLNCRIRQEALDVVLLHSAPPGVSALQDHDRDLLPASPEHVETFYRPPGSPQVRI